MKLVLFAAVLAVCAVTAAAAFTIPQADGLVCDVTSVDNHGHAGPPQTVKYVFLGDGKFFQDDTIGSMKTDAAAYTLGEPSVGLNGSSFSAISVDRASGSYRWEAHGADWAISTRGKCHRLGH